jgi:hypothetical protein
VKRVGTCSAPPLLLLFQYFKRPLLLFNGPVTEAIAFCSCTTDASNLKKHKQHL